MTSGGSVGAPAAGRKTALKKFYKNNRGLLFVLPWLIGFLIFKCYPFLSSLYYSLLDYNLFKGSAPFTVPLKLVFSLFIAYILNFKIKGVKLFRTIYYIPSILGSSVAIAVVWKFVFQSEGLINRILMGFGLEAVNWLGSAKYSIWVICLLHVWQFGSAMVIFLAALKGVPQDLYEAAQIDGAGKWTQFFKVTIPLITPVIFYNAVTQICTAFQEFNSAYLITKGGPLNSTTLISLLISQSAFKSYDMGLASAMAWILFIIVAIFTAIAFLSQKYWVYYSDDSR